MDSHQNLTEVVRYMLKRLSEISLFLKAFTIRNATLSKRMSQSYRQHSEKSVGDLEALMC